MNIVILFNETHAYDYVGCAGFPLLQTPTADALAADGLMFEEAVCATTPCLPSRHNLLHGLHAFQTGIYSNGHLLPPDEIPSLTMGRAFQEAGYRTAECGKGHHFPYGAVMERGSYFGFDYRVAHFHETGDLMDDHFGAAHPDWVKPAYEERESYGCSLGGDGCAADYVGYDSELPLAQTRDWWLAEKAAAWIEDNKDAPFLLICSLSGPHTPNAVPSDYVGLYDPEEVRLPEEPPGGLLDAELYVNKDASGTYDRFGGINRELLKTVVARYMACVTATDACHALVVDALKRNGLYDDTLVIFLADHGDLMGSRGLSAYSKYNLYERAIRVPLIVKPPKDLGDCPLGQRTGFQASLIDILPTMLDVAGLPGQEHLPGTSLKPLLLGQSLERENPVALTEFCLHRDKGTVFASVRTPEWKLIVGPFGDELYHLREDPNEFHNLGQDPGQASRIAKMKAQLVDYYRRVFRRNGDTRLGYEKTRWDVLIKK